MADGTAIAETPPGPDPDPSGMASFAAEAATFVKAFGHDGRLMILCYLLSGPRSVGELERLLDQRQAAVSQQLARLRLEGIVQARREAQTIYYSLRDDRARRMLLLLKELFCPPGGGTGST